jgi:tRNA 2-thiouridine synthesizing protein A
MDLRAHAEDAFLDTGLTGCGSLVIALRKALQPLPPGALLHVRSGDAGAREDIPAWCRLTGHTLVDGPTGPDRDHYFIRKRSE